MSAPPVCPLTWRIPTVGPRWRHRKATNQRCPRPSWGRDDWGGRLPVQRRSGEVRRLVDRTVVDVGAVRRAVPPSGLAHRIPWVAQLKDLAGERSTDDDGRRL